MCESPGDCVTTPAGSCGSVDAVFVAGAVAAVIQVIVYSPSRVCAVVIYNSLVTVVLEVLTVVFATAVVLTVVLAVVLDDVLAVVRTVVFAEECVVF